MLTILLVVLCIAFRVVPHPANFAPVGATAVFAGRTLPTGPALLLVAVAMFLGDVALGQMHGYPIASGVTPFVYGGFAAQVLLGRWLRARRGGAIAAALAGALSFFVLSNLGVWIASGMYPHTSAGLVACYVTALPFLGGTLLGDVVWTGILSAVYRLAAPQLEESRFWVPVPPARVRWV